MFSRWFGAMSLVLASVSYIMMALLVCLLLSSCQHYNGQAYRALAAVELEAQEVTAERCVALQQGAIALREGDDTRWRGPGGTGQAMEYVAGKHDRQAVVCSLLIQTTDDVSKVRALRAWQSLWRAGLESVGEGS